MCSVEVRILFPGGPPVGLLAELLIGALSLFESGLGHFCFFPRLGSDELEVGPMLAIRWQAPLFLWLLVGHSQVLIVDPPKNAVVKLYVLQVAPAPTANFKVGVIS